MASAGRENPVTRPSVYRTQDAQNSLTGGELGSLPAHPFPHAHFFSQPYSGPAGHGGGRAGGVGGSGGSAFGGTTGGYGSGTPPPALPSSTTTHLLSRSTFVDPFSSSSQAANSRPLRSVAGANPLHGPLGGGSPTSPALGQSGLPRQPSVRTFSQLSAVPIASPTTTAYPPFATDAAFPSWAEYNRTAPPNPTEVFAAGGFAAEPLLQRPLGPDTIREAVYAYLEATDRHDVVAAMLADERPHTQRTTGGGVPASAAARGVSTAQRASSSLWPSAEAAAVHENPLGAVSALALSSSMAHSARSPRDVDARSTRSAPAAGFASAGGGAEGGGGQAGAQDGGRRGRQRRSHELLRKGLLDRRASVRPNATASIGSGAGLGGVGESGRVASPGGERRTGLHGGPERSPRLSAPAAADGVGRGSAAASAAAPSSSSSFAKPPTSSTQRQHLPKVLPTLCGLEEAVRPDLVLLFTDLETKILEQYRQLRIPPPSHEVLQYVLTQCYEPMWSVGEDANVFHLFPPTNPVTGMVLYGTLNQMVEELTRVHVMPLSTPAEIILKSGRSFAQAFLRRHRLLMPSHVLLAKLMERYLVPLSLPLGFERFKAHGITVHVPGMGASLPPRRSQSETVLHGRRHPAAASGFAAASSAAAQTGTGLPHADSGVWGSRSARPPSPGRGAAAAEKTAGAATGLSATSSAAVEEYVRASAAATSPDAALLAMVGSGMLPNVTTDSIAAITNAAIGAGRGSTVSSAPGSTTFPHRTALGGFSGVGSAAHGTGNAATGGASRPAGGELVTTYSPSAALWLTVCERVQLKVLSVLLYWLQHHPHHFDAEMLRSVLRFVESCCYGTCQWADAPSRQPQIAEFIRHACHAAMPLSTRRPSAAPGGGLGLGVTGPPTAGLNAAAQFAAFPPISTAWRDGVLSGTWERRRYQLLSEAIPPSLRGAVTAEQLPWTWITPMGSLTPAEYLPCFAFRPMPSADGIVSYPGEPRHSHERHRSAGGTPQAASDTKGTAGDVARLHAAAQEALRLFGESTFETYVRGLTAAHYRMFTAFPSQDIFIAAQHTTSSYLTSPAFQSSFLGLFLNSSVLLTSWCVSLLLHAAVLDGERAAAAVAVTNLSILHSFVGDVTDFHGPAASDADGGGGGGGAHSRSSSLSLGNSSVSTATAATASLAAASATGGGGNGPEDGDHSAGFAATAASAMAAAAARHSAYLHNPARQFLHVLDRLVDLVVGFLRVNNLHASYSIYRGLHHPFVRRLRLHPRIVSHTHAQTAHRIRKLEGFFTSIPPTSASAASQPPQQPPQRRKGKFASAEAAGDPTADDDFDGVGGGGRSDAGVTGPASDGAPRRPRKPHHSFFEYLNTVPDSVEYPTVPVVQYYLRELQMMFALEPTFFTVPTHHMQSRFVSEEVRLTGLFSQPTAAEAEEQVSPAASPIAVVNWRKMHLVDDWIQRVGSNQVSCLHYISARSTVVRHIVPDLAFEKAFDAQLSRVVVTDTALLQEMANLLYTAL